jgi:hypothetical protein
MPLIQPAICIGLFVFLCCVDSFACSRSFACCMQNCMQSDWPRIGTITACAGVRSGGIPGGRKKLPISLGFKCAYCGGEFGSRAGMDCHRRHRTSIGTPCADPMNSQSMSLTQRGDTYTGTLRLHDTLGVRAYMPFLVVQSIMSAHSHSHSHAIMCIR